MGVEFGKTIATGPLAGCVSVVSWGTAWPAAIPIYVAVVFGSVILAAKLSLNGQSTLGLALIPVALVVGTALIGAPHCGKSFRTASHELLEQLGHGTLRRRRHGVYA
jgi:hypothetical protein